MATFWREDVETAITAFLTVAELACDVNELNLNGVCAASRFDRRTRAARV